MSSELMNYLPIPVHWRRILLAAALFWSIREITFPLREKNLNGEVVVITGAGGGIGRLMAIRLAKNGCKLALLDVNLEAAEKVAAELRAMGSVAKAYKSDVSNRESVRDCAKAVLEEFGRCDILINNAGIVSGDKLLDESDAKTQATLNINTLGIMWMLKEFLPGMIQRKHGHCVTIASSAGRVGVAGLVSYCASKFGAVGVDESLRSELNVVCPQVKTTVVCPGYINTGMFEGARMRSTIPLFDPLVNLLMPVLEPEYVADKIVAAIKRNQTVLVMPKFAYLSYLFRALIPTAQLDIAMGILGVSHSMSHFKQTRTLPASQ